VPAKILALDAHEPKKSKPVLEPRVTGWIGIFAMELVDRAELPPSAAVFLELLFRRSATPQRQRIDGWFPFRTAYLRKCGIARSTIRRELHRLQHLKLIEIQPYKTHPGHPVMVRIPDRFFGARKRK
jgi:hypothetical protein